MLTLPDRFTNFFRLALSITALTLAHRLLILDLDATYNFAAVYNGAVDKISLYQEWWPRNRTAILTGGRSDILFILSASCLAFILSPRWMFMPLIVLSIFYAANIEHLRYNFSHIRLGTIHMALDPTFLAGSGLTSEMTLNLFSFVAISISIYRLSWKEPIRYLSIFTTISLIGATFVFPRTFNPLEPGWMQTHPLALDTRAMEYSEGDKVQENFPRDALSSGRVAPLPENGPAYNILVVYLEGVSQHSIAMGKMPFLQWLAEENVSFPRYFGNQLQTNNGLYTTLTGHYPNFLGVASPWDTLTAEASAVKTSLPNLLSARGYTTSFLQSADLSFMNKAMHLSQIGFDEVRGRESWTSFYSGNGWGVDDLSLFEGSLNYIDSIQGDTPWLVSLLTSGTHSPYNVPADFLPGAPDRVRAIKYADYAAEKLMNGLHERNLLKDTVVIFTADESREPGGRSNLESEILLNWLPLIVVHPNGHRDTVDWPLGATEFRDLVLRVSGDWDRSDINVLNRPDKPLIFGNHYKHRLFWFDRQKGHFYACYTGNFLCAQFTGVADVMELSSLEPTRISHEIGLKALFEEHEAIP